MDNVNASAALIEAMCNYLTQNGKYQEGIFRISPNRNHLVALRARLREEGDQFLITDLANGSKTLDPHTIASLLKLLLSEFSEPLLGPLALSVVDYMNRAESNSSNADNSGENFDDVALDEEIQRNFFSLPSDYQRSAEAILTMLHELVAFSNVTRMGASQLSVVLAPALFGCPDTPESLSRFHKVTQLMHRLIVNPLKRAEESPRDISNSNNKRFDVESWLAVVRSVIRERFFPRSSSEMRADLPTPSVDSLTLHPTGHSSAKSNTVVSPNARVNISIDLIPPTLSDIPLAELGSTLPFASDASETPSSSRSIQLTRIAGILCERFGISTDRKKHSVAPVEEKIALQRALLQLEGSFGRPIDKTERQIVRPLYERYRELKRLAANSAAKNYRHHVHHETRRHKHQFGSTGETNGVDGLVDIADVRWAMPSSNNNKSASNNRVPPDSSDLVVDLEPQCLLSLKHGNSRSEKRRFRESRSAGAEAPVTSPTSVEDGGFNCEKSNLGEIALNSSSG